MKRLFRRFFVEAQTLTYLPISDRWVDAARSPQWAWYYLGQPTYTEDEAAILDVPSFIRESGWFMGGALEPLSRRIH